MLEKQLTVADLFTRLQDLIAKGLGHCLVVTEGCDCDGDAGSVRVKGDTVYIDRVADVPTEAEHQEAESKHLKEIEKRTKDAQALWNRLKQGPIIHHSRDIETDLSTEPLKF